MPGLRWFLGLILVVVGGGFAALSVIGSGFRKSFGASPASTLVTVVPVIAILLLLAGLISPANRILLHAGAIAAIVMIGVCVWFIFSESAPSLWLAVCCLIGWLYFYWATGAPRGLFNGNG